MLIIERRLGAGQGWIPSATSHHLHVEKHGDNEYSAFIEEYHRRAEQIVQEERVEMEELPVNSLRVEGPPGHLGFRKLTNLHFFGVEVDDFEGDAAETEILLKVAVAPKRMTLLSLNRVAGHSEWLEIGDGQGLRPARFGYYVK